MREKKDDKKKINDKYTDMRLITRYMFLRQLLQPLLAGTLDFVAIIRRYDSTLSGLFIIYFM